MVFGLLPQHPQVQAAQAARIGDHAVPGDPAVPHHDSEGEQQPPCGATTPFTRAGSANLARGPRTSVCRATTSPPRARLFIASPDLVSRFALGHRLAASDPGTHYHGGPRGYTDYPVWAPSGIPR